MKSQRLLNNALVFLDVGTRPSCVREKYTVASIRRIEIRVVNDHREREFLRPEERKVTKQPRNFVVGPYERDLSAAILQRNSDSRKPLSQYRKGAGGRLFLCVRNVHGHRYHLYGAASPKGMSVTQAVFAGG